jgi:lipid-A-disaccharide synthase-like uncharacterized protein
MNKNINLILLGLILLIQVLDKQDDYLTLQFILLGFIGVLNLSLLYKKRSKSDENS